jgi:hypothetical protein
MEDILAALFFWLKMRRDVPYLEEEDELESRTTQMQEGEDDVDINTSDTSQSDFWSD